MSKSSFGESTLAPRSALLDARSYAVPRADFDIELWLDGNEGQEPDPELLADLAKSGGDAMRRYPNAGALVAAIADRFDLDPEFVLPTAGADEGLDRVCRAWLDEGRSILLPEPGFEMLERYARLQNATVARYRWFEGEGGAPQSFPVDEVIERASTVDVVAIVSPNNPTGLAIGKDDFVRVAESTLGKLLLVDLAYVEFADFDLTDVALCYPHVVVVRSLSKSWGIAGLRCGFCAARPELIAVLRAAGSPYSVAAPSLWLAAKWLERGAEATRAFASRVVDERAVLANALRPLARWVWPSQANFVFARVRGDAIALRDAFARRAIAVRAFPGHALIDDCLRVTVPHRDAGKASLLAAIAEIAEEDR